MMTAKVRLSAMKVSVQLWVSRTARQMMPEKVAIIPIWCEMEVIGGKGCHWDEWIRSWPVSIRPCCARWRAFQGRRAPGWRRWRGRWRRSPGRTGTPSGCFRRWWTWPERKEDCRVRERNSLWSGVMQHDRWDTLPMNAREPLLPERFLWNCLKIPTAI